MRWYPRQHHHRLKKSLRIERLRVQQRQLHREQGFFGEINSACGNLLDPFVSTPPNRFNIYAVGVCRDFGPYSADMLCYNTAVPLAVIAPNTLINPFFIKDLSWIWESSSTISNSLLQDRHAYRQRTSNVLNSQSSNHRKTWLVLQNCVVLPGAGERVPAHQALRGKRALQYNHHRQQQSLLPYLYLRFWQSEKDRAGYVITDTLANF